MRTCEPGMREHRSGRRIAIAITALLAVGCSSGAKKPREDTTIRTPVTTRVLFIGNSYTYRNNLPAVFRALALSNGDDVVTEMIAPGGATLQMQWATEPTRQAAREGHWDYVVLQEQSTLGVSHMVDGVARVTTDEVFLPAAKSWADAIHSAGAMPVFFASWARREAPDDQALLDRAFARAAEDNHARLAPIGAAWARVADRRGLFVDDGSHPSPDGTYLAALVIYQTSFDRDLTAAPTTIRGPPVDEETEQPLAVDAVLVELSVERAHELQAAARLR
jgi:hypothetical protein